MAVYKADILDIELNTGNIARSFLCHNIGKDDTKADRFGVRVYRDGEPESLSGCSIQGYMMRPNGTNLAITGSNTGVSGNEAWVDLPQAAYDYEGQFCLALKLIGGGVTGTIRIIDGMINNTFVSDAVAPTAAVPTYQEILSVYDQMVAAKAGSVRFDTDQTLTAAQKTQARGNIEAASESDVSDLKSASNTNFKNITDTEPLELLPGFLTCDTNPVDTTNIEESNTWKYGVFDVEPGQIFTINARGGSGPRAYAVLNSSNNSITGYIAGNGADVQDFVLTIPSDGARLIINDRESRTSYKGNYLKNRVSENRTDIISLQNDALSNKENTITEFKDITGVEILPMIKGHYLICNENPVNLNNISDDSAYQYGVFDVLPGQKYLISARGQNGPRAYAVLDSSNNSITGYIASNGANLQNFLLTIPANGVKLIINDYDSRISYKGSIFNISDYVLSKVNQIYFDSLDIKAQLDFEPGGIDNNTGKNSGSQLNRLRTKDLCYTEREIVVCRGDAIEAHQYYSKTFFWADGDYKKNKSSDSGWVPANTPYTIPAKSYFRIVLEADDLLEAITDVYSSVLFKAFNITNTRGKVLNDLVYSGGGTDVSALNGDMQTFVQSIKSGYPSLAKQAFSSSYTPLSILHFSDIHRIIPLWERIMEYADEQAAYLDFALHTGDYVNNDQRQYTDLYNEKTPENIVVYNCVGNHDAYAVMGQGINPDKSVVYGMLFNHTSNWNVTFESDISNSMTYYKDFTGSNIRLIVLDNYYDLDKQCAWLAEIMADAQTKGLSVITAAHQATAKPSTKIDTTFQTLIPYDTNVQVNACVNTPFDEVIATAKQNGCKHIIHLAGHEHQDWFFRTSSGVLNCVVECATDFMGWTEGNRVNGTKSYDCFNVVGVDTELGIIKIIRIGHNVDCMNRSKNIMTYDYVNDRVLCNV